MPARCRLDGRDGRRSITAYPVPRGRARRPGAPRGERGQELLRAAMILGMGFTFDDTNQRRATPIAEMRRLIAKDPRNAERIFPYIGGEEVNDSPTHAHHRYVINFGEMTEDEARQVARSVGDCRGEGEARADREANRAAHRRDKLVAVRRHAHRRCTSAIAGLERVIADCPGTASTWRSPSCRHGRLRQNADRLSPSNVRGASACFSPAPTRSGRASSGRR